MSTSAVPRPVRDRPGAVLLSKTVSEADVYLFAGITGDFYPLHLDAEYAATQPVGERIAHGALVLGFFSAAAARWAQREGLDILSAGYDRLRFIRPVRFGDTLTVAYAADPATATGRRMIGSAEARNQHGEVVCAAEHLVHLSSPASHQPDPVSE
ncbi:MaoC family dehydratase [Streptomyces malaysiensis]|uniref:MaoC family dehydratase n=1 Tax=Streptomyces malaysiensis TaxID=92644 RepID=UPI003711D8E1